MDSAVRNLHPIEADEAPSARRRPSRRVLLVAGLAVVAAAGGIAALRAAPTKVTTDNAYIKSDQTFVAPRVRGLVAEVLVEDNQPVSEGQPLVRLSAQEYAARVAAAEGELALAQAQVDAAQAGLARLDSELDLAAAQVREAGAGIRAGDAEAARAQADRTRFETLAEQGFVARRDAERARADAVSAEAGAEKSRATLMVSREQAAVALRRRGEMTAQVAAAQAQRAQAAASLALAQQDLGDTLISAPIDGVVADRQMNAGDYAQPGARLLTLVPGRDAYVVANFKETQTGRMLPGQEAVVKVDALPGVKLKARVDSLSPGSGSQFALLPFEPGAGNFTKIVQRVPVKLVLLPGQPELKRLRSGLSVKVSVKVAPGLFDRAAP